MWIPAYDPPEKDGKYLVAIKHGDGYSISTRKYKKDPGHWTKGHSERETHGVRFWMPLPLPPQELKVDLKVESKEFLDQMEDLIKKYKNGGRI